MPQDPNLPGGVTQQDTDGGVVKMPTDDAIWDYLGGHWRDCEVLGCDIGDAEIDGHDSSEECVLVTVPMTIKVDWVDVN